MEDAEQLNSFLVDVFGRINKIEERAMAGGLGSAVSITEIHIIEKIGDREPVRMSEVARSIGVTLATLTVACDKLVAKGLVRRVRSQVTAALLISCSPTRAGPPTSTTRTFTSV